MVFAPINELLSGALWTVGVAYVITGSQIGFGFRAVWKLTIGYIPIIRKLTALAFCPSCCAWWIGLVSAFLLDKPWWMALQFAFTACGLTAIAQGIAGLAAEDEDEIDKMWRSVGKTLHGYVYRCDIESESGMDSYSDTDPRMNPNPDPDLGLDSNKDKNAY